MARIERRHRIVLSGPIEQVFPLFTPEGEKRWVEGWDPTYFHPTTGETCEGMVFRTEHGGEVTLWACIAWIPDTHQVRYARVTPESRFGFVDVKCRVISPGQTEAVVSYVITALSAAGDAQLATITEQSFAQMIEGWRERIDALLQKQSAASA